MFDNYNNIPDSVPNNQPKPTPKPEEKHPLGVYNAADVLLGFTWNKEDNVTLVIPHIDKELYNWLYPLFIKEDWNEFINEYFKFRYFEINVYDFRGNLVSSYTTDTASKTLRVEVQKLELDKGIYSLEVRLIKIGKVGPLRFGCESGESGESGDLDIHTIFERGRYSLFVK